MEAIKENNYNIYYIENPSEEVQLESVRRDAYSLRLIKNPTDKVRIEAVKSAYKKWIL